MNVIEQFRGKPPRPDYLSPVRAELGGRGTDRYRNVLPKINDEGKKIDGLLSQAIKAAGIKPSPALPPEFNFTLQGALDLAGFLAETGNVIGAVLDFAGELADASDIRTSMEARAKFMDVLAGGSTSAGLLAGPLKKGAVRAGKMLAQDKVFTGMFLPAFSVIHQVATPLNEAAIKALAQVDRADVMQQSEAGRFLKRAEDAVKYQGLSQKYKGLADVNVNAFFVRQAEQGVGFIYDGTSRALVGATSKSVSSETSAVKKQLEAERQAMGSLAGFGFEIIGQRTALGLAVLDVQMSYGLDLLTVLLFREYCRACLRVGFAGVRIFEEDIKKFLNNLSSTQNNGAIALAENFNVVDENRRSLQARDITPGS